MSRQRGFTLLETLVVILVGMTAMAAAIAVAVPIKSQLEAAEIDQAISRVKSEVRGIYSADPTTGYGHMTATDLKARSSVLGGMPLASSVDSLRAGKHSLTLGVSAYVDVNGVPATGVVGDSFFIRTSAVSKDACIHILESHASDASYATVANSAGGSAMQVSSGLSANTAASVAGCAPFVTARVALHFN